MRRWSALAVMAAVPTAWLAACGARTGLLAPPYDGASDVLPPLDVTHDDVTATGCLDAASSTLVYAVTNDGLLLSFYPPTATFETLGMLQCLSSGAPFSMAVDRKGTAYVEYDEGNGKLFKVSTVDASCAPTSFANNDSTYFRFGMGYAAVGVGPSESLFIASADGHLATLDTTSFAITTVGPFDVSTLQGAELTGTGDGRLYAYYAPSNGFTGGSFIAEIDKTTAKVLGADPLGFDRGNAWAFAFWGGDFWVFTAPNDVQTTVKYDPVTKTSTVVAHYGSPIVGAGVSTCAPQ